MGFGFGVSVLSLVETRCPIECLPRFATRFFLNLRSIVYHQRASIFGDYATPIDPPASRTGPFRNQLGRPLASMFLDLGMDKTVCSSGTNPNNGDIEQADIIDLEVIELQEYQLQR